MATCTLECLRNHQQLRVPPWVPQQVHSGAEGLCVLWRVPGIDPTLKGQRSWNLLSTDIGYLCLWGQTHLLRRTNRWQSPLLSPEVSLGCHLEGSKLQEQSSPEFIWEHLPNSIFQAILTQ